MKVYIPLIWLATSLAANHFQGKCYRNLSLKGQQKFSELLQCSDLLDFKKMLDATEDVELIDIFLHCWDSFKQDDEKIFLIKTHPILSQPKYFLSLIIDQHKKVAYENFLKQKVFQEFDPEKDPFYYFNFDMPLILDGSMQSIMDLAERIENLMETGDMNPDIPFALPLPAANLLESSLENYTGEYESDDDKDFEFSIETTESPIDKGFSFVKGSSLLCLLNMGEQVAGEIIFAYQNLLKQSTMEVNDDGDIVHAVLFLNTIHDDRIAWPDDVVNSLEQVPSNTLIIWTVYSDFQTRHLFVISNLRSKKVKVDYISMDWLCPSKYEKVAQKLLSRLALQLDSSNNIAELPINVIISDSMDASIHPDIIYLQHLKILTMRYSPNSAMVDVFFKKEGITRMIVAVELATGLIFHPWALTSNYQSRPSKPVTLKILENTYIISSK